MIHLITWTLDDGAVAYWTSTGEWSTSRSDAAEFATYSDAQGPESAALRDVRECARSGEVEIAEVTEW